MPVTTVTQPGAYERLYAASAHVLFVELHPTGRRSATLAQTLEAFKGAVADGTELVTRADWSFPEWATNMYVLVFIDQDGVTILNEDDPSSYDVAQLQREVPETVRSA